jgi:hypothetical protein
MLYANATINSTKLFDDLDLKSIAVRDNGVLKVESGAVINKKFKYFNNSQGISLSIEVFSNMSSVICVKTP